MNYKLLSALAIVALALCGCTVAENKPNTSQLKQVALVSRVIDGDTVEIDNNVLVRLLGINAPEKGEYYYYQSAEKLRQLIEGKIVELEKDGEEVDSYGRELRHVFVKGESVSQTLLKGGFVIAYMHEKLKYSKEIGLAQNHAKSLRIGLWERSSDICGGCIGIREFVWDSPGNECKDPNSEFFTLENTCSFACDLNAWRVKDRSASHRIVFNNVSIPAGDAISIHSGCGENSQSELYWCGKQSGCQAVWNNEADTLFLISPDGKLALYQEYGAGSEGK